MGIPIKSYLIKQNIERNVMKAFLQMFQTDYPNVRIQKWEPNHIELDDLLDLNTVKDEWKEHCELFHYYEKHGRGADFTGTNWWKREHNVAPVGIRNSFTQRRLDEILGLYDSIKKSGYVKKSGNLMKVLDIRPLTIKEEPKWKDRITAKYYRLNGKRRCLVCHFLKIKSIIVSVVKVKIVKL